MQASRSGLQTELSTGPREDADFPWTPFDFRAYLESREGKVWRHEDTLKLLNRAEQIDALIQQLMRAVGIKLFENN